LTRFRPFRHPFLRISSALGTADGELVAGVHAGADRRLLAPRRTMSIDVSSNFEPFKL
jgi:hypothetical protein